MRYTYAYKTSDGTRHEASMDAKCREAVFQALRKQGIKPIKVIAADGSKANGEIRGVRKRVVAALVALAAIGVGVLAYVGGTHRGAAEALDSAKASPRHQIYGDPAILARFESGVFDSILTREGDRILAWYAQPGKLMCGKNVNPRGLSPGTYEQFNNYAQNELTAENDLPIMDGDPREVQELKQIVNGIRDEFRNYLANGNGTARSFIRRLNERTMEEMQIFERTRRDLMNEKSSKVWDEKNDALRRIGLRTITNEKDED